MSTPAEKLLPHIQRVRQTGPGVWSGSCPTAAHRRGDQSRGLRIREAEDGRLLIWCGAGCSANDIVASVGLDMADLFPESDHGPDWTGRRPKAPPIPWRDVFTALETDLTACSLAFADLAAGKPFSPVDAAYIATRAEEMAAQISRVRHGR
jgi:hypothetical protein